MLLAQGSLDANLILDNCRYLELKNSRINTVNPVQSKISTSKYITSLYLLRVENSTIERIIRSELLLEKGTVVFFDAKSNIRSYPEVAYRELRQCAVRHNDTIQSLIFYKKLLELRLDEIRQENWTENWDDKILLRLEQLSNNFGTSVIQPILLMLILNLIFAIILYLQHVPESLAHFLEDVSLNFRILSVVLNVNPLASFTEISGFEDDWLVHLDYIRRILLAVLIYQTIVAARRFAFVRK